MIHEAYMPVYMGSRFLARDGRDGTDRGSTRGPRRPKKTQCKSLKSVLCVCNTLVRLYDLVYLLLVTCLCLYILSWDKGFCNKHFVYEQGFVQVGDKIL